MSPDLRSFHSQVTNRMEAQNYQVYITQLDLLTLAIDRLEDSAKVKVVQHMQESLDLLKLGSSHLFGETPSSRASVTQAKKRKLDIECETSEARPKVKEEMIQPDDELLLTENNSDGMETETVQEYRQIEESVIDQASIDQKEEAVKEKYVGLIPTCTDCDAKFMSLGALDKHMKTHENVRPMDEDWMVDGWIGEDAQAKNTDDNMESKVEPTIETTGFEESNHADTLKCEECGRTYANRKSLSRHRQTHKTTEKFHCDICDTYYTTSEGLRKHEKRHERQSREKEQKVLNAEKEKAELMQFIKIGGSYCDVCDLKYTTSEGLKKHEKTQSHKQKVLNANIQVNTNSNNAPDKNEVNNVVEDTNDDNIELDQCAKCQKYFPDNNSLKEHMSTHDNDNSGKNQNQIKKKTSVSNFLDLNLSAKYPALSISPKVKPTPPALK